MIGTFGSVTVGDHFVVDSGVRWSHDNYCCLIVVGCDDYWCYCSFVFDSGLSISLNWNWSCCDDNVMNVL